jgi:hypothetical protein
MTSSAGDDDSAIHALEDVLFAAAKRLVSDTLGARDLDDVARITGRPYGDLLAEATGIDRAYVRLLTGG